MPLSGDPSVPDLPDLESVVSTLLGVAARLIGLAAFVMILFAGFQFLTAAGDPKKAEAAQKTLTAAVVGIFLIILGWLALKLLEQLTGTTLTQFDLSFPDP